MFVGSARNILCSSCVICFSLHHSSLQHRKTTERVKIEQIGLQSYQNPGESQTDRKATSASLCLPTTYYYQRIPQIYQLQVPTKHSGELATFCPESYHVLSSLGK
jgi:hypothetical protein